SFNSAQRPVSSSSSSQRVSCFGSSVLPSVRSVVTTSVRVGGGGLLWPISPPSTRIARGGEGLGVGGPSAGNAASVIAAPPPTPDPSPPLREGGGGGFGHLSAPVPRRSPTSSNPTANSTGQVRPAPMKREMAAFR